MADRIYNVRVTENEPPPGDRLGAILARLNEALKRDPDWREGDRAVLLLDAAPPEGGHGDGAIAMIGYATDAAALRHINRSARVIAGRS